MEESLWFNRIHVALLILGALSIAFFMGYSWQAVIHCPLIMQ